jgi:hypothetical protein
VKNTKLIKMLKTFSAPELKKFRDFVKSPFYNKNKNVIKLSEALVKYYPDFSHEALTEKFLYTKIFGSSKFNYFKIKNIISDLYNLGIEFLKLKHNIYTAFYKDHNLLVELRTRKLWRYHKKAVKALEKEFSNVAVKDSVYLYDNYLLTMESHLSNILEKPNSVAMIQDEFNSFYEFSMLNLLKFYNLMMHISKENNITIDMKMIDDVINYSEKNIVSDNPTVVTYKYLVLLAAKRKEEYFFFLKKHFLSNYSKMSYEDAYYANMYMAGYCTDKYNINGERKFIKESYDLLKHSYKSSSVTLGELLYPNFINYVKVFTRAGDSDLAREFITDYKDKLPPKLLESCLNFSNAYILQYEGKFTEALKLISKVSFPWVIMKIQVKIMQVQLNYQLGYFEETRDIAENFRKSLVKEESISEDYKQSVLGFLKFTIALISITELTEKQLRSFEVARVKEEINVNQANHFGIKFWLEDRLYELEKNPSY